MAVMAHLVGETIDKVRFHLVEIDTVLRTLGAGQSRNDVIKVQFQHSGVGFLRCIIPAPEALGLGIGFDARHGSVLAPREAEVVEGALVDREEAAGGAVFGRHVGDGGAVGQRKGLHADTKELDKLPDHAVLTKHLNNAQRHVGGGHAGLQTAGQANANNVGSEHVDRLAKHDGLGLNAAHTPSKDAQAVDHGRVGIGAHQGIGQPNAVFLAGHAGEEFEVDLVNNAARRRNSLEVRKGLLAPLEKGVAFHVAVVFDVEIHVEGVTAGTGNVHLHRVVDDQIHGHLGVDLLGVTAHLHHGVAKCCQIHDSGHAGEVLENDARGAERNLASLAVRRPRCDFPDVILGDEEAVVASQSALEQNADGVGQMGRRDAVGVEGVKGEILATDTKGLPCVEGVQSRHV